MVHFTKKLSWWKSLFDNFLILVVIGLITGWMKAEFYSIAVLFLIGDFIVNLTYLIKSISR